MGLVTKRLRRPIGTAEMMASPQEHIDSETAAGALREDYAPSWADGGSYTLNCAIKGHLKGQVFTLAVKRHSICFSNHQR